MRLSLSRVDEEGEAWEELRRECGAVGVLADDPPLAVPAVLDQSRLFGVFPRVDDPVFPD